MPSPIDSPQKNQILGKAKGKKDADSPRRGVSEESPRKNRKLKKPAAKQHPIPPKEGESRVDEPTPPTVTSNIGRMDSKAAGIYLGGEANPISEETMSDWRYRGNGKGPRWVKVGRLVRYTKEDLDAYLATRHMGEE